MRTLHAGLKLIALLALGLDLNPSFRKFHIIGTCINDVLVAGSKMRLPLFRQPFGLHID